jgi:hypothetical protein
MLDREILFVPILLDDPKAATRIGFWGTINHEVRDTRPYPLLGLTVTRKQCRQINSIFNGNNFPYFISVQHISKKGSGGSRRPKNAIAYYRDPSLSHRHSSNSVAVPAKGVREYIYLR